MDCAAMRSEVTGDFQEPYGAVFGDTAIRPALMTIEDALHAPRQTSLHRKSETIA
jgi:hypothetical protein